MKTPTHIIGKCGHKVGKLVTFKGADEDKDEKEKGVFKITSITDAEM